MWLELSLLVRVAGACSCHDGGNNPSNVSCTCVANSTLLWAPQLLSTIMKRYVRLRLDTAVATLRFTLIGALAGNRSNAEGDSKKIRKRAKRDLLMGDWGVFE